ncbi:MAG: polysaccharide deacetylase family protein [Elusimicrobiales bacterium]|nr:polysaccharide deacetylase family protein [Elusimicrobiales bacterium]
MTGLIAGAAAVAAAGFSARWNWWRPGVKGLSVLMYHKIGTPPKGPNLGTLWVSSEMFAKQVDYLLKHGFTPVLFRDIVAAQRGGKALPEKPVLITFDDGYKNNYTQAYRILKEKGAKGNIFLVYNTMEKNNEWHNPDTEPWLPMLSWAEVNEMLASGVMDMGSHTMNHANLAKIPLEKAGWEMRESKKRLEEKLGHEIPCFAYPYGSGAFVPEVRKLALEAGYLFDFSVRQGISPWPWTQDMGPVKRIFVRGDDFMLDFHLNMTRGKARF